MPKLPAWRRTLEESRRQALVAVDFYNRPGDRRSFGDFVIHIHLAWQNLIHADRMHNKLEIYYRERGSARKYVRNPDGSKKTWDLARCLREEFADNNPIRVNVEFFIGLRNYIEHHFQDSLLHVTSAETHALIINFESELVRRFGEDFSLSQELKFPVFVQSLKPDQYREQLSMRRSLPLSAKTYISEFENSIPENVSSDDRYAYKLLLMPIKGSKSEADMALNFVRADDLTEDERKKIAHGEGNVIIAEKYKEVANINRYLPSKAAKEIEERIPFRFTVNDFTALRKNWLIGPESAGGKMLANSQNYAVPDLARKDCLYTQDLIEKAVEKLQTSAGFEQSVGRPPKY